MKGYVCGVCGYIPLDGVVPDKCPVCNAPKTAFAMKDDAIVEPSKETNKLELNKKHIPLVTIVKQCKLIPEGCTDVQIKIGEILHPMTKDHFIMRADVYLDKKYVSRVMFTPENVNPALSLHLHAEKGKVSVISLCNLHGAWLSEVEI